MKLKIVSRSGKELIAGGLTVPDGATVDDLKAAFHAAKRKFYPTRQRFTLPVPEGAPPKTRGVALESGKSLGKDHGLKNGDTVVFKDLGPQCLTRASSSPSTPARSCATSPSTSCAKPSTAISSA